MYTLQWYGKKNFELYDCLHFKLSLQISKNSKYFVSLHTYASLYRFLSLTCLFWLIAFYMQKKKEYKRKMSFSERRAIFFFCVFKFKSDTNISLTSMQRNFTYACLITKMIHLLSWLFWFECRTEMRAALSLSSAHSVPLLSLCSLSLGFYLSFSLLSYVD